MISLKLILKNIEIEKIAGSMDTNIEIENLTYDSRTATFKSLFIAIRGNSYDGHNYIESAIENGACAIVCEELPKKISPSVSYILTKDSHYSLGVIASNYYNNPSNKIKLVGITGTNGKTTTVTLLYNLFTDLGYKCGLISTIENYVGKVRVEATHTTPDPLSLNNLLYQMNLEGCEYCFMEVSSHALSQERVSGLTFYGAIFSNITHDHLDYHKTFIEYIKAKKRLFDTLDKNAFALINSDDKNGETMIQNCNAKVYRYSTHSPADFNCKIVEKGMDGMQLNIGGTEIWSRFIGEHNAYNLLAVYATAILLNAQHDQVLTSLSKMGSVAGRLEYTKGAEDLTVFVDYAHTPDALENVLKTLNDSSQGRELITVFGCGGNRDRSKRPKMGQIAAKYSTKIVVTSDNPRFEDPDLIIEEIKEGLTAVERMRALFITDRREAIRTAIAIAPKEAVILIAGKGHETYQDINGIKSHFDDMEIVKEFLNQKIV